MAFVVKENEAFDPMNVSFLGAVAVVLQSECAPYLVEQFWRLAHDGLLLASKCHRNHCIVSFDHILVSLRLLVNPIILLNDCRCGLLAQYRGF
jgi:hypothetical protein